MPENNPYFSHAKADDLLVNVYRKHLSDRKLLAIPNN